jgi:hypothetical protein
MRSGNPIATWDLNKYSYIPSDASSEIILSEGVLHALRTLLHFQSANLSAGLKDDYGRDIPQKIRLGTAHCACIVSVLLVERVAALVQSIDL